MPRTNPYAYYEDEFADGLLRRRRAQPNYQSKRLEEEVVAELSNDSAAENSFEFTYNASRHERLWLTGSLEGFYDQQWFTDVLQLVKGGKEASVYQCQSGPTLQAPYLAAKVYRPRRFRNLKNDHLYREGRTDLDSDGHVVHDDGMLHAMRKRTEWGRELLHTSWIEHEVQTMRILHAAGADIPEVYASGDNAILMEYIGGDELAAPTMNGIELEMHEARPLFERVLHNIELMLSHDRVHGDLSAYNLLYWEGGIKLIDFPQAIAPGENRNAFSIFQRDVARVCEYFSRQGVSTDASRLAAQLWKAHHLRTFPEVDPALLDGENEADRAYWRRMDRS